MKQLSPINEKSILTTSQKVLFMAVIPEACPRNSLSGVLNRESSLFKKLHAHGFLPSPTVGALSTGMTTYEFINIYLFVDAGFSLR
jgi:hypothetical protein